jgi:hypothetical protein
MSPTDGWPFYLLASLLVLLLLRLLRVADTASSTRRPAADTGDKSPSRWFRGRKLDKLASTTALSRANTELFHSKIDELQAHRDLEQLVADLQPPAESPVTRTPPAITTNTAALTLAEIEQLLAVVEVDQHGRAEILRLAAARLAEKCS